MGTFLPTWWVSMLMLTAEMNPLSAMLLVPLTNCLAPFIKVLDQKFGAANAVALVLPTLKGKLNGIALRVPTPKVFVVDLVVQVCKKTFAEEVNAAFRESAEKELTCTDVSSTVDSSLTMVMGDDMTKVIAWYDHE